MTAAKKVRRVRRAVTAFLCAGLLLFYSGVSRANAAGSAIIFSGGRLENRTARLYRVRLLVDGKNGPQRRTLLLKPGQTVDCLEEGERLLLFCGRY